MTPGQGAPAAFEEGDVAEPAAVHPPAVLEADRGGQALLDGGEALHLLLHLQRLHREAGRFQHPAHARLVVGEAGHAAGLLPLVDVEGHHGQATPGGESGAGPLHDGVRGTEMGGDELGVPWVVGDALHVGLVELDVGEASRGRPSARLLERGGVAVEAHHRAGRGGQGQRQPARAAAHVEHAKIGERLAGEELEEAGADARRLDRAHAEARATRPCGSGLIHGGSASVSPRPSPRP